MGMVYKLGRTVLNIKDIGKMIKLMGKEYLHIKMGLSMKGNGRGIKHMVLGKRAMLMEGSTRVSGSMTCSMGKVLRFGRIIQLMMGTIIKERNTEKELIPGKMALNTQVNGI